MPLLCGHKKNGIKSKDTLIMKPSTIIGAVVERLKYRTSARNCSYTVKFIQRAFPGVREHRIILKDMCLIIEENSIKITANEDVVVYKYVVKTEEGLETPFWRAKVVFNEVITSDIKKTNNRISMAIHSCIILQECLNEGCLFGVFLDCEIVYIKCIIPKGSKYYIGTFGGRDSYASNQLIYKEIIE